MRIPWIATVILFIQTLSPVGYGAPSADFFVSPTGNDHWTGTLAAPNAAKNDGPLATLAAARDAVRRLKADPAHQRQPVTVLLRDGVYFLADPIKFGANDSGSEAAPIVYAAYPDENPILSGGVRIAGWKIGPDGRWRVNLPDVKQGKWNFSQLFVNGHRRYRPRLPRQSYWLMAGRAQPTPSAPGQPDGDDRFRFPAHTIDANWKNRQDIEVTTFHPWFTSILRVGGIDPQSHIVTFTGRTCGSEDFMQFKGGMRFLVDNVAEALDTPGQWYLDRPSGELTYIPLPGETPGKSEVIAPRLDRLMLITASTSRNGQVAPWVENLTFRGLTFAHCNWNTPAEGYSTPQAAVSMPAAVMAAGARHIAFDHCAFTECGTYGLEFGAVCQKDRVERCRFTDLGAGGIKIGVTSLPHGPDDATGGIVVHDNLIAHIGRIHPGAVGVWVGQADHCSIEHNDIYDTYYTAISVGWTWGYGPSAAHHNEIAFNHAQRLGQGVLSDMGGIYSLGVSPGTTIHHNRFHDIQGYSYGGWGIYFDEGTSGVVAENNLCYRASDGDFHQHYGENNVFSNNVLLDSRQIAYGPTRIDAPAQPGVIRPEKVFTFERNIVSGWNDPSVVRPQIMGHLSAKHLDKYSIDHNVYWNAGKPVRFAGLSFQQWQAKGLDKDSIVGDPKLIDPLGGKVRVQADSPALKLGFKEFDVSSAGRLHSEPADLDPAHWPRAFPPPPGPQPIEDDFEQTPVGDRAIGAHTNEENDHATIRVTDETAFTGRHSLKFIDAPGQRQFYNPHLYWEPHYSAGTAICRFALRPERGASIDHEWRTQSQPYHVGPSLHIDADGALHVRGVSTPPIMLPLGKWTVFEFTCPLGKQAGKYNLTITLPGQPAKHLTAIPCDPDFKALAWFGFSSSATADAVFYLDNVKLGF